MRRARMRAAAAAGAVAVVAVAGRRARGRRRVRALASRLEHATSAERIALARALVDEGLTVSAPELLLFVRTELDPAVLHDVARAIRDAPAAHRPSANLRELLLWSDAQLGALPSGQ
ncbi:MAG: hypothetical protein JOZ99_04545 [Actinobacteria bacterium]|nr:hypothetical protein [Actinomycetota bacterium]